MTVSKGKLETTTFSYDGGRDVTVYVPAAEPTALVLAGDGQLIAPWGRLLSTSSTVIVGVHRTSDPDEMVRIGEYSPTVEPARFAAHESFVLDEIWPWALARFGVDLPPERTACAGVSASAEFALAMGIRHPEHFGVVLAASPGAGYQPPVPMPNPPPRCYLVAGSGEPFFRDNAVRWADALRAAGADVVLAERPGEHGGPFWQAEFPAMVAWAFGG